MDSLTSASNDKKTALARRYGAAIPPAGPWNEVIASLLEHRSVRGYRPDPLPAGTLETMIAAASSAATSSNMQWWSAIAVTDPETKKKLAVFAGNQKHIEQCPLFIAWVVDMSRNQAIGDELGEEFTTMPWLETWLCACMDVSLAAQNAVVAAEAIGLGTVYIGAMRNHPLEVAELLGLPRQSFVLFGLCVGYPTEKAVGEVKPRLPQTAVLHHERYDATKAAEARRAYDAEMMAFSARHELAAGTWTARVRNRLAPMTSMQGRERLRGFLKTLGFDLR
jgi:nitroreductase